jgi:urease accessory protein
VNSSDRCCTAKRGFAVSALALLPALAGAHQEAGQAAGLLAGLVHPVSGLDHVLAMIAVGLWGAVLRAPAIWVLPVAFPMVMALGGLMGLLGVPVPAVEIGIAGSAIVLGIMVLGELRPPLWAAAAIVAFFGVFHGHAHGREVPDGASVLLYSLGFVIATGLMHGVGIVIGVAHRWELGRRWVRVAGAGVAMAGLYFLWQAAT